MVSGPMFEPRILGFLCNWCCYAGADLAGVSRFQYPPNMRTIRLMCSGRVDPAHVFRAFAAGLDAVFIGGCHLNDCHYVTHGNYDALSMVHICKKIMERIGLDPARLRLEWVSAGEGIRFAAVMQEFVPQIRSLGPLGKGEGLDEADLKRRLGSVTRLIPYIKLVQSERLRVSERTEEAYAAFFAGEDFNRLFDELIGDKLASGPGPAGASMAAAVPQEKEKAGSVDIELIDGIIDRHKGEARSLVQVLLEIQQALHWLPPEALERAGERLKVPMSRIRQIVTFHTSFSLTPMSIPGDQGGDHA